MKKNEKPKKKIYYLIDRYGQYLYHFVIFNIGALIYILNNMNCHNMGDSKAGEFKDKTKLITNEEDKVLEDIYPIPIYMDCKRKFQIEAFDIIKDKFTLITDISKEQNYCIKQIYGVPCTSASGFVGDDLDFFAPEIRKLFLDRIPNQIFDKNKRIFITRTGSNKFAWGKIKRCVLNEEKLIKDVLEKHNIQYIRFEDYNFEEKIRLFNSSSLILSTLGSALVFSIFANNKTKIVEMVKNGPKNEFTHHYSNLTSKLNLPYYRYSNIVEDNNGNFNVNTQDLNNYLEQIVFKS